MNNSFIITPAGDYCIFLTHGDGTPVHVIVDAAGLEKAREFKGHFYPYKHQRTGKLYARGYYRDPATKKVEQPLLHRLIMNPLRGQNTAHISGDTLDCTRANMQNVEIGVDVKTLIPIKPTTQEDIPDPWEGQAAKKEEPVDTPPSMEPLKGVSLHKVKQRWEVSPFFEGKRYRLGYWDKDDIEGANAAVTLFRDVGPEEYFRRYPKGGKT